MEDPGVPCTRGLGSDTPATTKGSENEPIGFVVGCSTAAGVDKRNDAVAQRHARLAGDFGILLGLLLITMLVSTLVKVVLPEGPLRRRLLKLRGGRYS
jgi:hypothetical protein